MRRTKGMTRRKREKRGKETEDEERSVVEVTQKAVRRH